MKKPKEIIEIEKKGDNSFICKRHYRSCRNCRYFIRVNERQSSSVTSRGFNFCSQDMCEFGLHLSSSVSRECEKFDFDEKNMQRTESEDDYEKRRSDYADKYSKKLAKTVRKSLPKKSKFNFMHWMFAEMEFRSEGGRQFDLDHLKEKIEIRNNADIDERQYTEMLDGIREYIKRFLVVEKEKYKRDKSKHS
jgi:hypothetical protein